jgi:hypothetical protein
MVGVSLNPCDESARPSDGRLSTQFIAIALRMKLTTTR